MKKGEKQKKTPLLFYRSKHSKSKKHSDQLTSFLLPSFLGMILCMVALASVTWAWFSTSVISGGNIIQTGTFSVTVAVTDNDQAPVETTITGDATDTKLQAEKTYHVTLSRSGSIKTGYCKVMFEGENYIHQFSESSDSEVTFTIQTTSPTSFSSSSCWGSYSGDDLVPLPPSLSTATQ